MPRKARLDAPGALHHIIVRGIARTNIFYDDTDRDNFLQRLGDILTETRTSCYAWALIPNHVHILLRTGLTPVATVMRRLLTGHAMRFNRRHRRQGHLFQNRYKSILCQEDPYLLELVRYIHLNPLRAKLVSNIKQLDRFCYSGHSVIIGERSHPWQDIDYVLRLYGNKLAEARRRYRLYVQKGIARGRRPDLVGGGLVRSMGGWSAVKALRGTDAYMKGDERILGDGDFVKQVLEAAKEQLEQRYYYQARGYDLNWLVDRVAQILGMDRHDVLRAGKYAKAVKARSVLCYWATRELGISTVQLAKQLKLAQSTVSQSVVRGEKIVSENEFNLLNDSK
jgi:REP element-mobilizing transposase RayT